MIPPRPQRPTPNELRQSWDVTVRFLEKAKTDLPVEKLSEYEHCLAHNELELAFDELERIGEEAPRSVEFLKALIAAAENMGLELRASALRRTLDRIEKKEHE